MNYQIAKVWASTGAQAPEAPISLDTEKYRATLSCYPTGITVVSGIEKSGRRVGLTVNSFTSVSLDPPLVAWSLRQESPLLQTFQAASHFAVNVLGTRQARMARCFAGPADDRFRGIDSDPGAGGVPLIRGCAAWLECATRQTLSIGDHVMFVGEVVGFGQSAEHPIVLCRGIVSEAPALQAAE